MVRRLSKCLSPYLGKVCIYVPTSLIVIIGILLSSILLSLVISEKPAKNFHETAFGARPILP